MTLKTMFAIPIAIILIATLALAGMVERQAWSGYIQGKPAVEAVERMRVLLRLQTSLRTERIASIVVLGRSNPGRETAVRRLADARTQTDLAALQITAVKRESAEATFNTMPPEPFLITLMTSLEDLRNQVDRLIPTDDVTRPSSITTIFNPEMTRIAEMIEAPMQDAGVAVVAADPALAGLVTEDRLAASLRDRISQIAALVVPAFNRGEWPAGREMEQVRGLLSEASYLTRLLTITNQFGGSTAEIQAAFAELATTDLSEILDQFQGDNVINPVAVSAAINPAFPQKILLPWAEQVSLLRAAFVNAAMERVTVSRARNELQFNLVMVAIGAVIIAVLESVVLLGQRVVVPLSQLGQAITRIAGGDRSVPLEMVSGTREITEMVTAIETLRRAAVVADAAETRQRMVARHRLEILREALSIAQTVQQSARLLEQGVARLSEGIDATMEFVLNVSPVPPPTLGTAADAVRQGLAEMRQTAAALDATFAAASSAQAEDRPEAEFVACILAMQEQVARRSEMVRGFLQPSLVALRDATTAGGGGSQPELRHLLDAQFARIEETVAVIAAMLSAVTRASAIVRDLPSDETLLAA